MKERPILFNGAMVRTTLDGSKTQTRRVVKPIPQMVADKSIVAWSGDAAALMRLMDKVGRTCPYGQPGDRFWVKETFYAWGLWDCRYSADKGRDVWHFTDRTLSSGLAYRYAVDVVGDNHRQRSAGFGTHWKRPAIFMPRAASRIDLKVVSIRVERLQDISEADALAEGIDSLTGDTTIYHWDFPKPRPNHAVSGYKSAYSAYKELWCEINGRDSWDANPWVWVVEFRRAEG